MASMIAEDDIIGISLAKYAYCVGFLSNINVGSTIKYPFRKIL
jgi:hypothetical protein